jgi:hypothetical protein
MEDLAEARAQQHLAAAQAQQEEGKASLSTVHQQPMSVDHQLTTSQTKRDTLATRAVVDRVEEKLTILLFLVIVQWVSTIVVLGHS